MLHYCKRLANNLCHLNSSQQIFLRHLRTKPTSQHYNHLKNETKLYNKPGTNEQEGGHVHLLKSRGQHLLTNPRILNSIVRTSGIRPDDTVLEIGPGTGNLTLKLLEMAKKVVAIEVDKRMVEVLGKRVAERGLQDRLCIISGDALKTEFPQFDLIVANIPYNISSPLIAKFVFGTKINPFRSATLLLQKEFARRLLAKPGDSEFNRLAVNVNLVADVEFVMDVSKRDFVPCPKVDSSVVKLYPKTEIPDVDLHEWWAFTRTCFSKKNKTLGATFKQKRKLMELMNLSKGEGLHEERDGKHQNFYNYGDGDDEEISDQEDSNSSLGSDTGLSLFRGKVISILGSGGFVDKRPSKLCNDELRQLLTSFNQGGIYFHDQAEQGLT